MATVSTSAINTKVDDEIYRNSSRCNTSPLSSKILSETDCEITVTGLNQECVKRMEYLNSNSDYACFGIHAKEIDVLQHVSQRVELSSQLVIVRGPPGSGKTTVARSLNSDCFYFLEVKFDQLNMTPEPYQILVSIFSELSRTIGDNDRINLRENFEKSGDIDQIQVLADMIHENKLIFPIESITTQPTPPFKKIASSTAANKLVTYDPIQIQPFSMIANKHRFQHAICVFLLHLAMSIKKRFVLFFDDIHWASQQDLDMLISLVTDFTAPGILFIIAYRDGFEYQNNLPNLEDIRERVTEIQLGCVNEEQIKAMISQTCSGNFPVQNVAASPIISSIAEIIMKKSNGNLLLIHHYLQIIQRFMHQSQTAPNPPELLTEELFDGPVLFYTKISALSEQAQECLKIASCFGTTSEAELIRHVVTCDISTSFDELTQQGWLDYIDHSKSWKFSHDIIQEIAHESIPDGDKATYHYRIAKKLWRSLHMDKLVSRIFVVVAQFVKGKSLIRNRDERAAVSRLFATAGEQAVKLSEFHTARTYFLHGIEILDCQGWQEQYDLCLTLHSCAAECSFSSGVIESVHEIKDEVLHAATCFDDTLRVRMIDLNALNVSGRIQRACDDGLGLLELLGERFPKKTSVFHCLAALMMLRREFKKTPDEVILNLPVMTDTRKLVAMQVLQLTMVSSKFIDAKLCVLVGLRMAKLTLDHGCCAISCLGMVCLGAALCSFGCVDEGYHIGELSLSMYDKFQNRGFLARLYVTFFRFIHCWKRPERESIEPLMHAQKIGLQTGDIEMSMSCGMFAYIIKVPRTPVEEVSNGLQSLRESIGKLNLATLLLLNEVLLQAVHNLQGFAYGNPEILTGKVFSEEKLKELKSISPYLYKSSYYPRLLVRCLFDSDSASTMDVVESSREVTLRENSPSYYSVLCLFRGLCYVAHAKKSKRCTSHEAQRCCYALSNLAKHGSEDFACKLLLLKANLSALRHRNRTKEVMIFFDKAIDAASKCGNMLETALANEGACKYLFEFGSHLEALAYLRHAVAAYKKWGATGKVEHLLNEVESHHGVDKALIESLRNNEF